MSEGSLEWHNSESRRSRDIRQPREVYDDERRAAADQSLRLFLESYFPQAFPLAWSDDHLKVIEIMQRVASTDGLFALAMPRGSGKTTIAVRAALWAILTKRRCYVEIIGSTERAAQKIIKTMRSELSFNQQLRWDYPAELHGIWQLQGDNRKSGGQLCEGQKTGVVLGVSEIVFPTHQYSPIGGSVVYAAGLTGNVRGPNHTRMDGTVIRPDFVILDDPQTRESATSAAQTQDRSEIVDGDVLGLAGPDKTIAAVMPCTVIAADDLADKYLGNPRWNSIRAKLLNSFPDNMPLWDQYFEIRQEELRVSGTHEKSDEFYRQNFAEMNRGGLANWEARKKPGELTALQSGMHLWHRNPMAFAAEYQNEPTDPNQSADMPSFAGLESKLTRLGRGIVPTWATHVVAGIDVQKRLLMYVVLAFSKNWTASIIEYGAWPHQPRSYFTRENAHPTLHSVSGSSQDAGAWRFGLDGISEYLCGRKWQRDGGGELSISRALIDAGDGNAEPVIFRFCRESPHSAVLMPSKGQAVKAAKKPMGEWPKKPNEEWSRDMSQNPWIIKPPGPNKVIRNITFDGNPWKKFLADRAAALPGEAGSLSLYGDRPEQHQMLKDHLAAETPTHTFGQGRWLWEWSAKPNSENDYLDALVMAGVAASTCGAMLSGDGPESPAKPRKPRPKSPTLTMPDGRPFFLTSR